MYFKYPAHNLYQNHSSSNFCHKCKNHLKVHKSLKSCNKIGSFYEADSCKIGAVLSEEFMAFSAISTNWWLRLLENWHQCWNTDPQYSRLNSSHGRYAGEVVRQNKTIFMSHKIFVTCTRISLATTILSNAPLIHTLTSCIHFEWHMYTSIHDICRSMTTMMGVIFTQA